MLQCQSLAGLPPQLLARLLFVAALVLLISVDLPFACVRGLVSPLMVRVEPPSRDLFSDEFNAKANPSVQRVMSAAEQPQIVGRSVAARRPRPDVIVFEKGPSLAASPICRHERTAPLIARVDFAPHVRGNVTAALFGIAALCV